MTIVAGPYYTQESFLIVLIIADSNYIVWLKTNVKIHDLCYPSWFDLVVGGTLNSKQYNEDIFDKLATSLSSNKRCAENKNHSTYILTEYISLDNILVSNPVQS